jgi:transposase
MDTNEFFETILGVVSPWHITEVIVHEDRTSGKHDGYVEVMLEIDAPLHCPVCGRTCHRHDSRTRRWRHSDSCEYQTILVADIPRVMCREHGVKQVAIPWSEGRAPYTAKFEAHIIAMLLETTISATSRLTGLKWDAIDGIQERAVQRGLDRRKLDAPVNIGVDETSFQKRHEYVTIVMDQKKGTAIHVSEGKGAESLDEYYKSLSLHELNCIKTIAMDMSHSYLSSTLKHVAQADTAVCFDRFHVTALFNKAISAIRVKECRSLLADGDTSLVGTRHDWLYNDQKVDGRARRWFHELSRRALATARAWAMKETANGLWHFASSGWATRAWKCLTGWMDRCQIPEMQKLSKTIKKYLWGIINAVVHGVTNGPSESLNAKIQKIKARACGFRNKQRFINAIYFHLGGLDLMPESIRA